MFEIAALTYGLIASFVMASVSRNRREARVHPPLLVLFGWVVMSFSITMAIGLLAYAGLCAFTGTPVRLGL